jgi:hypothetical protein
MSRWHVTQPSFSLTASNMRPREGVGIESSGAAGASGAAVSPGATGGTAASHAGAKPANIAAASMESGNEAVKRTLNAAVYAATVLRQRSIDELIVSGRMSRGQMHTGDAGGSLTAKNDVWV